MKTCRPVCLLALMMFAFPLAAQQTPKQLDNEPSSDGSPVFHGLTTGDVGIPVDYGRIIEDNIWVNCYIRFDPMVDIALGEIDYGSRQGGLNTDYYLSDNGAAAPYLGIEVGWRRTKFGSVRESGLFIGSKAGIKFFLSNSISIDTSVSYKISTGEIFIKNFEATDSYFYPRIGLKALF